MCTVCERVCVCTCGVCVCARVLVNSLCGACRVARGSVRALLRIIVSSDTGNSLTAGSPSLASASRGVFFVVSAFTLEKNCNPYRVSHVALP